MLFFLSFGIREVVLSRVERIPPEREMRWMVVTREAEYYSWKELSTDHMSLNVSRRKGDLKKTRRRNFTPLG